MLLKCKLISQLQKKVVTTKSTKITVININSPAASIVFEPAQGSEPNSENVLKLTVINSDMLQVKKASDVKQFLYVKIFVTKNNKSAQNSITKGVKTFLCIKILKRK